MTGFVDPQAPIDYHSLKNACRLGLSSESRQYWYPILPSITVGDAVTEVQDIHAVAGRLADMVKLSSFAEQVPDGTEESTKKIVHVLIALDAATMNKNGTKDIALVTPLMEQLSRQIDSLEVCYLMGCEITTNTSK
jgi:hypothetical protein